MKIKVALLGAAAVIAIAADVNAGLGDNTRSCSKNADGSGSCFGSMRAFRNSSDSSSQAFFGTVAQGTLVNHQFVAVVSKVIYTCVPPPGSAVESLWTLAHESASYFSVMWDAGGNCTYLNTAAGSASLF